MACIALKTKKIKTVIWVVIEGWTVKKLMEIEWKRLKWGAGVNYFDYY